jgi:hypothetical protein
VTADAVRFADPQQEDDPVRNKLGLKPVHVQPSVSLCAYYTSDLPSVDSLTFPLGHADAIQPQMFCNNVIGDCAIAGSIEEVRLANALAGKTVNFTDQTAIENYSAITGYVPDDPATDQGTDVHELFDYRTSTGIIDADGQRHTIIAYAGLTPRDFGELLVALSLFDMVGVGIQVPDFCEAQFDAGQPWHPVPGRHTIEGGHYVPLVGALDQHTAQVYTWGATQLMTDTFYNTYCTTAVVALTAELFTDGKSIDGIDFAKLAADLPELNTGPVSAKAPRKAKSDAESTHR